MDIVARAKSLLLSPNTEWRAIATERTTAGAIYTGYIMPLSAIPPIATLIGFSLLFGRLGLGVGLIGAIVSWALGLGGIYVAALIAQWLAPKFDGSTDFIPALKLVAYSHTASWVGGIFLLIPFLGLITVLMSLYGLYLLYAGATPAGGVPKERAVAFTVALVVCVIVVFLVIGLIMRLIGLGAMAMMM